MNLLLAFIIGQLIGCGILMWWLGRDQEEPR